MNIIPELIFKFNFFILLFTELIIFILIKENKND